MSTPERRPNAPMVDRSNWWAHATPEERETLRKMEANLSRIYGELKKANRERAIVQNRITKRRAYRERVGKAPSP